MQGCCITRNRAAIFFATIEAHLAQKVRVATLQGGEKKGHVGRCIGQGVDASHIAQLHYEEVGPRRSGPLHSIMAATVGSRAASYPLRGTLTNTCL